jgi:flagellar hook-associated protein 2
MALATTTVSGLVSGLDTASIIQQLMSIERRPITLLELQVSEYEAQKSAFSTINTSLLALKTAADELSRETSWLAKAVSVSDESVLSAEVTSATPAGTYKFTVSQLAAASQLATNGFADPDTTAVGAGSFDITVGASTETIAVGAGDTLDDVAAAINAKDMGATAVVVNTGAGATPYKLIVTSDDTGVANETAITNNTSGLVFTEITEAKNAILQFGEDSPITVESDTNTVTGLADGMTLDLKSVSAGPVTVTVESDTTGILEQAKDFVSKYNAVQSNINKYTDYDEEAEQAAVLFGNSTLRFVSSDLSRAVGDSIDGVPAEVNSLMMVGFTLKGDGTLEFDEEVFASVLEDNLDGVSQLFSGVLDRALGSDGATIAGPAAEAGYSVDDLINGNTDQDDFGSGNGFLAANPIAGSDVFTVNFNSNRSISQLFIYTMDDGTGVSDFTVELQKADGSWETIDTVTGFTGSLWADVLADPLTAQAMRVTVTGTNAGDGKTRLLEIKANEEAGVGHRVSNQLSFITRGTDGAIATEQESLEDRIRDTQDQIAELEERLLAKEERLRAEFTAMEMALAQMQSQANFFLTQLSSMPSSGSGSTG